MLVTLMKAKLHRATVTQADLEYEGSIAIDRELLERLRDGKVYVPEQARAAIDAFFTQTNLNALRELAAQFHPTH